MLKTTPRWWWALKGYYTSTTLTPLMPRSAKFSAFPIQQTSALGILYHCLVHPPLTESWIKITSFLESRYINKPLLMIRLWWLELLFGLFGHPVPIEKPLQLWSEMATKVGGSRILTLALSWRSMHFSYFEMSPLGGIQFIIWYAASDAYTGKQLHQSNVLHDLFIPTGCQ